MYRGVGDAFGVTAIRIRRPTTVSSRPHGLGPSSDRFWHFEVTLGGVCLTAAETGVNPQKIQEAIHPQLTSRKKAIPWLPPANRMPEWRWSTGSA
jgi:hypothetical protein